VPRAAPWPGKQRYILERLCVDDDPIGPTVPPINIQIVRCKPSLIPITSHRYIHAPTNVATIIATVESRRAALRGLLRYRDSCLAYSFVGQQAHKVRFKPTLPHSWDRPHGAIPVSRGAYVES
jgi:hypothetical protein